MSFSGDVKEELVKVLPSEAHCRMAELAALIKLYGRVEKEPEIKLFLSTDNLAALRKCFTLLNKTFNIRANVSGDETGFEKNYIELSASEHGIDAVFEKLNPDDPMKYLKKDCCQRAYLRGAFLASGFVNDPNKGYHFELLSADEEMTKLLTYLMLQFNISPKRSVRKKYSVLYIKESETVCDILSVLGAHKSMMEMANTRIIKDFRNSINRKNNCDAANIIRSVETAGRQIEDIEYIKNTVGLDALPDTLREMANIRMEYPDSSFSELGNFLNPPVGKSGVNHRLRKISEYAFNLRNEREKT